MSPDEIEECRVCGQRVLMMCMKWTGYCNAAHEEDDRD